MEKKSMKRPLAILALFFSLLLIFNLSKDLIRLSKAGRRIEEAQETVKELELKNWRLQQEKQYRESPEFLEKEIRDKLMKGKPGEVTVILPSEVVEKIATAETEEEKKKDLATWQQWLEIFK